MADGDVGHNPLSPDAELMGFYHPPDPNPGVARIFPPPDMPGNVVAWRIYYGDGSTYDSQNAWDQAPDQDVQAVKVWFDHKDAAEIYIGEDAYLLDGNQQWKYGRWIEDDAFEALQNEVEADECPPIT